MKRRTIRNLAILILLIASQITAQPQSVSEEGFVLEKVIPPSPTASKLSAYSDIQSNLYIGAPNISIPIWEVKGVKMSVPISLSYNSNSIRLNTTEDWMGQGWSLFAGGVISRSVCDIADEDYDGFLAYRYSYDPSLNYNYTCEDLKRIDQDPIDSEPDIFNFNFLNHSGRFLFSTRGENINIIPYQNLKIEKQITSGRISQFTITDNNGITYIFGGDNATETAHPQGKYTYIKVYNSAWYLKYMISPDKNDTIQFDYQSLVTTTISLSETQTFKLMCNSLCGPASDPCIGGDIYSSIDPYANTITYSSKRITSIKSRNEVIEFDTIHKETINDFLLNKIIIFDKIGNTQSETAKKSFNLSFIKVKKRYFLSELQEIGKNGNEEINPYRFEYNNPQGLPDNLGFSNAIDHWGYYNGAASDQSLLPFTHGFEGVSSGNRNTNPETTLYGIIKKIRYPTGGTDNFIFEANEVQAEGVKEWDYHSEPFFYNAIVDGNTITSEIETFTADANYNAIVEIDLLGNYEETPHNTVFAKMVDLTNTVDVIPTQSNPYLDILPVTLIEGHTYRLEIQINNNLAYPDNTISKIAISWKKIYVDSVLSYNDTYVGGSRIKEIIRENLDGEFVSKRNYEYKDLINSNISSGHLFSIPKYYDYYKVYGTCSTTDPSGPGGCWEQHFIRRSSNSVIPLGTSGGHAVGYEFVTEYYSSNNRIGDNGKQEYQFTHVADHLLSNPIENDWQRGQILSKKTFKFDSLTNDYSIVKHEENAYENFFFPDKFSSGLTVKPDISGYICGPYPCFEEVFFNERRYIIPSGRKDLIKKKETTYDLSNSLEGIVDETYYTYNEEYDQIKEIKQPKSNGDTLITRYKYPNDYVFTASQTAFENCLNTIDLNAQNNCSGQTFVDFISAGNCFKNIYESSTCIQDLEDDIAVEFNISSDELKSIIALQQANIIGKPVEKQLILKKSGIEYMLNGSYVQYDQNINWGNNLIALPVSFYKFPNDSLIPNFNFSQISLENGINSISKDDNYELDYFIDNYDKYGNVIEFHELNDLHSTILWGYNNTMPIAKIMNATYSNVQSYEANLQNLSNLDRDSISEANLRTALNNLRTALPNAMVTTYTYDPLIGMTSATNERGQTTYYEYDGFGRLALIRNNDRDIVKKFEYNYGGSGGGVGTHINSYIQTLNLLPEADTAYVNIETDLNEWTVLPGCGWITASSLGLNQLQIIYTSNTGSQKRYCELILKGTGGNTNIADTIYIIQDSAYLYLNPTALYFDLNGGTQAAAIHTNLTLLTHTDNQSWISTSKNGASLSVTCNANTEGSRNGIATVSGTGDFAARYANLTIEQTGAASCYLYFILGTYTANAMGETITANVDTDITNIYFYSSDYSITKISNTAVRIVIPPNNTGNTIIGHVFAWDDDGSICSDILPITQPSIPCTLAVSPESLSFAYNGAPQTITVTSNCEWSYTETGIAIGRCNKFGNTIVVTIPENTTETEHEGSVIVSVIGVSPVTVPITQGPHPPLCLCSVAPTAITASSTTICQGEQVTLTRVGGTLGDGASWVWYSGSCGGTPINPIDLTPATTTTYYVRAEGGSCDPTCNPTDCAWITITVNPIPIVNITPAASNICEGASVVLTASGASTYEWSHSSETTAEVTVSPSVTTTYTVVGTTNGCSALSNNATVTYIPFSVSPTSLTYYSEGEHYQVQVSSSCSWTLDYAYASPYFSVSQTSGTGSAAVIITCIMEPTHGIIPIFFNPSIGSRVTVELNWSPNEQ